jgi:hypothetical protein
MAGMIWIPRQVVVPAAALEGGNSRKRLRLVQVDLRRKCDCCSMTLPSRNKFHRVHLWMFLQDFAGVKEIDEPELAGFSTPALGY